MIQYYTMKTKLFLPLCIASILSSGKSSAQPSVIVETYQHSLTYALTLSTREDESEVRTASVAVKRSQKLVTSRFSNKEMLEALLSQSEEMASAMGGTIRGWSIVLITNSQGDVVGTAITKRNSPPIDVTRFFSAQVGPAIRGITEQKNSANVRSISLAEVSIELNALNTELRGVLNVNSVLTTVDDSGTERIRTANFTDLSGYWQPNFIMPVGTDSNYSIPILGMNGVVTGTVNAGRPRVITLNQAG